MTDSDSSKSTSTHPGILTATEIRQEIESAKLVRFGVLENVQGCSYDLRIGTIFRDGKIMKGQQAVGDQVLLEPGEIITVFTLEELELPDDVMATAFPINALSSQGLLVLNPGHIDPGYHGPLQVRAINIRQTPKSIDLGTDIFTVIFERLPKPTTPYEHNTDRRTAELRCNAIDVEQNPKSLARLVMLGKDKPLMTGEEVDRRVRAYWMTWIEDKPLMTREDVKKQISSYWATKVVLVTSVAAALFSVIAVFIAAYRAESKGTPPPIIITAPSAKIDPSPTPPPSETVPSPVATR